MEEGPAESFRPELIKRAKQKTSNYVLSDKTKLLPSDKEEEIKDVITGFGTACMCDVCVNAKFVITVRQVESRGKFLTLEKNKPTSIAFYSKK